jgi:2-polyprenyl-3-methyl-5-hydroxy-6-metoxy-1,4-benzoquinol methylase
LIRGYLWQRFGARSESNLPIGFRLFSMIPIFRQQLDYFFRHLPRRAGTLLDIGCGNGGFLQRAMTAGWRVTGVEPDPRAVEQTRSLGLDVHVDTLESFSSELTFDAVTLSHVIEHVPDPAAALRKVRTLLSPGGQIWIATPNPEGLGRWWYGRDWRGLEPPRHTVVLTMRALRDLLMQEGFADIRFHRRGRGARYILDASHETAGLRHAATRRLSPWIVDMSASVSPFAAEELVVTASATT